MGGAALQFPLPPLLPDEREKPGKFDFWGVTQTNKKDWGWVDQDGVGERNGKQREKIVGAMEIRGGRDK